MVHSCLAQLAVILVPVLADAVSPAPALTIKEALAGAVASNPGLVAVREAARARHQDVPEAVSAWLPTVQFNAGRGRSRTVSDPSPLLAGADRTQYSSPRSWTFSINQNLFRSGRDSARLQGAVRGVSMSHASVEDREQAVLLRAATIHLDTLRAEQVIDLRAASLATLEKQVRGVKAQYDVGDRTGADVAQAEAERDIAAADLVTATADLEVQRALFLPSIGLVPDGLQPAGMPHTLDEARRLARTKRPAVRAAKAAIGTAETAVRLAKAGLGPRVDLSVAAKGQSGTALPGNTETSLTLQLTAPLYQAGAAGARIRRARHVEAQRRHEWLDAMHNASQRVESAWRNMQAAGQRRSAYATAVDAPRAALAGVRREAEFGDRSTREVLDAERQSAIVRPNA